MSTANSIYCPGCSTRTSIEVGVRQPVKNGDAYLYEIGECNNCDQRLLVTRDLSTGNILRLFPNALPEVVDTTIPEPIRGDLNEAYKCQSVGAFRAAATMARRAVQNVCIEKGAPLVRTITKGETSREVPNELAKQIDWLYDERIITGDLRDWSHEVRVIGNAGAHPGDASDKVNVTEEDAEAAMKLAAALCNTLYVTPSVLDRDMTPKMPRSDITLRH